MAHINQSSVPADVARIVTCLSEQQHIWALGVCRPVAARLLHACRDSKHTQPSKRMPFPISKTITWQKYDSNASVMLMWGGAKQNCVPDTVLTRVSSIDRAADSAIAITASIPSEMTEHQHVGMLIDVETSCWIGSDRFAQVLGICARFHSACTIVLL